jgi:hypothetical protein
LDELAVVVWLTGLKAHPGDAEPQPEEWAAALAAQARRWSISYPLLSQICYQTLSQACCRPPSRAC